MRGLLKHLAISLKKKQLVLNVSFFAGLCLSIKDDTWAIAIEAALGKTLDTIIVDNHRDERLLKELARRSNLCALSPSPLSLSYPS